MADGRWQTIIITIMIATYRERVTQQKRRQQSAFMQDETDQSKEK
jgi:hypothetical protein